MLKKGIRLIGRFLMRLRVSVTWHPIFTGMLMKGSLETTERERLLFDKKVPFNKLPMPIKKHNSLYTHTPCVL